MSYELKKISVNSTDNIHTLSGRIYIPDGEIKGIFHIVHGMCEYIERYNHVMSAIAENGFVCCGYDNLGHGETVKDEGELGFISHRDGWKYLVNDVIAFEDAVKKMFPEKPLILMGHSMGSFIVRLAAESESNNLSKLIICGTGGPNPLSPFGLAVTDLIKLAKGEKYISKTVNDLAFGTFNKKFEHISKYDWISTDRDTVDKYSKDKLCAFDFTVSGMHDLVKLNQLSNRRNWFKKIRKSLPILLISGSDDPVGDYGEGVKKVYNGLKKAGCSDVNIKIYEKCRHEIHNDTCKDEVIKDIIDFITSE